MLCGKNSPRCRCAVAGDGSDPTMRNNAPMNQGLSFLWQNAGQPTKRQGISAHERKQVLVIEGKIAKPLCFSYKKKVTENSCIFKKKKGRHLVPAINLVSVLNLILPSLNRSKRQRQAGAAEEEAEYYHHQFALE